VVADDVDDGCVGPTGVVEVGQAVAEARPEVQQRRGRFVGHAAVAVGGARDDAFEERKYAPHLGNVIECGDEVHL
jgi:hypothetical protein